MREKDRDLRRRRQRRLERLRQRNQEEVAKRKTARSEGSKRSLKPNEKEADPATAAAGEKKTARKPATKKPAADAAAGAAAPDSAGDAESSCRRRVILKPVRRIVSPRPCSRRPPPRASRHALARSHSPRGGDTSARCAGSSARA